MPDRLSRELDRFYTPDEKGQTLLDYGCGTPAFLDHARQRGWATVGADFSSDVVAVVRASGHAAVLVGEEFEHGIADESVSSARLNHVIEHLYHPLDALAGIRKKIMPGGGIHLSTPNPASLGARVFRRRWHALDCPRHAVLFRPRVLRSLLLEAGFRDPLTVYEANPKDLSRSWGIVLYDRARITHAQIAAMAQDPVRERVLWPVALGCAFLSLADRYHVFARV